MQKLAIEHNYKQMAAIAALAAIAKAMQASHQASTDAMHLLQLAAQEIAEEAKAANQEFYTKINQTR